MTNGPLLYIIYVVVNANYFTERARTLKSKDMKIPLLLDYYGDMLTDNQRETIELYYDEDMSLAEIAEHQNISRQGVRDSIKRGEAYMLELEEKLGLIERIENLQSTIRKMSQLADEIETENNNTFLSRAIAEKAREIHDLAFNILL